MIARCEKKSCDRSGHSTVKSRGSLHTSQKEGLKEAMDDEKPGVDPKRFNSQTCEYVTLVVTWIDLEIYE